MYIAIERNCNDVNGTIRRESRGISTNPIVLVTLHNCQRRLILLYVFGRALTVIPVRFTNDEKLCVDSIGKK